MRAAVMEAVRKPLVVKDMPDPACPPNGVILRAEAEGICRSDWHAWSGDWAWIGLVPPMPLVMGHEFCGVIEEVGKEVKNFKKGDRVLVPFSQGDGVCEYCRNGHSNVCANAAIPGFSYWGGYGRYVGIPNADQNLVVMPDDVGFLEGASLGCRFMTSYHGVVDRAQVRPGEWVAVHGCGGIGLSAIHVAAAIGANVIAVDLDGRKLELAKSVGATHMVNAKSGDPDPSDHGYHPGRRARLGRCPRYRHHLPQFDHEPAQARPLAPDWTHHGGGKGRGFRSDRSNGDDGATAHRLPRDAGVELSLDAADG